MNTTGTMNGLPDPPSERELPDQQRHRRELLTMISARRPSRVLRWAVPLGAAAAVAAIAVTAAVAVPALGSHAAPGGAASARPPATKTSTAALPSCQLRAPGQCQQTRTYAVTAPLHALTVTDPVGEVTVTGSDRDTVSVTARVTYSGAPPDLRSTVSRGTLALGYSCPSGNCGVAYDLQVPRSLAVRITTGVGAVTLASLAGPLQVTTQTGAIHGQNLSGSLTGFAAGTGSVSAVFSAAPGRLTAHAGTGSVTLRVPGTASYAVTASASLGAVTVSVPQAASSGHVITATTGVGAITVTGS